MIFFAKLKAVSGIVKMKNNNLSEWCCAFYLRFATKQMLNELQSKNITSIKSKKKATSTPLFLCLFVITKRSKDCIFMFVLILLSNMSQLNGAKTDFTQTLEFTFIKNKSQKFHFQLDDPINHSNSRGIYSHIITTIFDFNS